MKKIFISYSWGNKEHQDWIVNLGKRLMSDTVDVILDRWSLKDGHDIHSFMEEMVKSKDIFRVLIICDKKYSEKADDREGGVGTETQIISPNLYSNEKQEKFMPIVLERDEDGKPYLPVYLSSRKYIDFSQEEDFEDSYEELLRNILEAPSIPKPKLGTKPPTYITENKVDLSETNSKIRTIENQIKKNQTFNQKYGSDFLDSFLDKLWDFNLANSPNDIKGFGEMLTETLKNYKPLREDYIKFIDLLTSNKTDFSSEIVIEFFENKPMYLKPRDERSSWSGNEFDTFKIIFQELFIYTIAVGIKNKDYDFISELLNSKYFIKDPYTNNQEPSSFIFLYEYHQNLENYINQTFNKVTGFGHYLITNLSDQINKQVLIFSDTLCYCVSYLETTDHYDSWFPHTYLYGERNGGFNFFDKMSSQKHFEKVKTIFDVKNESELKEKLIKNKENSSDRIRYGNGGFNRVPFVYELIDPEKISIYR
jgi:hypothetical protein